jgi:hypothetical protein
MASSVIGWFLDPRENPVLPVQLLLELDEGTQSAEKKGTRGWKHLGNLTAVIGIDLQNIQPH